MNIDDDTTINSELDYKWVQNNQFSGTIDLTNIGQTLLELDLENNNIVGTINYNKIYSTNKIELDVSVYCDTSLYCSELDCATP